MTGSFPASTCRSLFKLGCPFMAKSDLSASQCRRPRQTAPGAQRSVGWLGSVAGPGRKPFSANRSQTVRTPHRSSGTTTEDTHDIPFPGIACRIPGSLHGQSCTPAARGRRSDRPVSRWTRMATPATRRGDSARHLPRNQTGRASRTYASSRGASGTAKAAVSTTTINITRPSRAERGRGVGADDPRACCPCRDRERGRGGGPPEATRERGTRNRCADIRTTSALP
ncbi:hypothetical protein SAMN05421783_1523 [Thiocapsa roseopersicina]|uniref:Uncharacterized protein n=1 Tax=Thiocapsa roseopersicina TaxID=1058 RepID=A0A1H3DL11_THIRO|nr:hypothetical protein SAMN05421783_1523 [Thiocapsa roseopersicina]